MQTRRAFLKAEFTTTAQTLRLPWTLKISDFTERCTRCNQCVIRCPEKIIRNGDGGFPELDFAYGECTFCEECVDSCNNVTFIEKDQAPWDLTINITENCLAFKNVHCITCQEQCETEAISFVYQAGKIPQPVISQHSCSGCGACIKPCPTNAINLNYTTSYTKGETACI